MIMKYVQLGKKGPVVSTIGFGAWAIGGMNWGKTDDEVSKKALNEAIDCGVTFIDTADVYGFGHSETLIKEVIAERGKNNIIIATKAGNDFYNADKTDDKGYGAIKQTYEMDYIISATDKSLKRLDIEALDILQLHSPDVDKLEMEGPWEALYRLKKAGKIKYAGWSVQSFQESSQAFILERYSDLIDCIQVRYNLLEREAEKVLFPLAEKYGIGVIVRIPLLFGFLTGKFAKNSTFAEDDHRRMNLSPEKIELYLQHLGNIQPLFDHFPGDSMAVTSLRYCISHPACHTAIPGAKTAEQVQENCLAAELGPISSDLIPSID
jgi:aryl-alcohol dehydrogenase-like predicted oxidoreductase